MLLFEELNIDILRSDKNNKMKEKTEKSKQFQQQNSSNRCLITISFMMMTEKLGSKSQRPKKMRWEINGVCVWVCMNTKWFDRVCGWVGVPVRVCMSRHEMNNNERFSQIKWTKHPWLIDQWQKEKHPLHLFDFILLW